jgi:hypothetical protein
LLTVEVTGLDAAVFTPSEELFNLLELVRVFVVRHGHDVTQRSSPRASSTGLPAGSPLIYLTVIALAAALAIAVTSLSARLLRTAPSRV